MGVVKIEWERAETVVICPACGETVVGDDIDIRLWKKGYCPDCNQYNCIVEENEDI